MGIKIKAVNWRRIRLPAGVNSNLYMVTEALKNTCWEFVKYEENTYKLIITDGDCLMSIYLSKMTIQTALNHPRQGKTQLTRKNIQPKEFKALLSNPRTHTNKGYHYNNR